jgi:hypothetical protein
VSSLGSAVTCWSSAPTVITNGSLPGAYDSETGPESEPWFPAAATTTMPSNQRASTALSSGSTRKLVSVEPASEKLATRMLYCLACCLIQSAAAMTSLIRDSPLPFAVLMETSFAFERAADGVDAGREPRAHALRRTGAVIRLQLRLSQSATVRARLLSGRRTVETTKLGHLKAGTSTVRVKLPRRLASGSYKLALDATAGARTARTSVVVKAGAHRACTAH